MLCLQMSRLRATIIYKQSLTTCFCATSPKHFTLHILTLYMLTLAKVRRYHLQTNVWHPHPVINTSDVLHLSPGINQGIDSFTRISLRTTSGMSSVTMLPKDVREISCKVDTECTGGSIIGNHSECQPQEITDGRLGFAVNSTLVITVGITGNLLTLVAIPYVRIRSAIIFDPKCVRYPPGVC